MDCIEDDRGAHFSAQTGLQFTQSDNMPACSALELCKKEQKWQFLCYKLQFSFINSPETTGPITKKEKSENLIKQGEKKFLDL